MSPWRVRLIALVVMLVVAGLTAALAPPWIRGLTRAVAAYDVAAGVFLAVLWTLGMYRDPRMTEVRAGLQDPGRDIVLLVILVSVAAGLASAIDILALGSGSRVPTPTDQHVTYAIAVVAVAAGWLVIHMVFALRYAHMFYGSRDADADAGRGLNFPGTENPSDRDFAYFSFVVGMTCQVSDVQVCDPGVRRVVFAHGLLSFAYNTVILAFGINVLAGLIKH
jgi:uncharacterized membrane protein